MRESDAEEILSQRLETGGRLQVAAQADLPTLKRVRARCLEAGIPVMLGPCAPGG